MFLIDDRAIGLNNNVLALKIREMFRGFIY